MIPSYWLPFQMHFQILGEDISRGGYGALAEIWLPSPEDPGLNRLLLSAARVMIYVPRKRAVAVVRWLEW